MNSRNIVICDFDGTITKVDSINDFLDKFADKKWLDIEADWVAGKVSTCDAMRGQFGLVKNMTEEKLNAFFESMEIDETFIDFRRFAAENNIKIVIVSDGFEYFIRRILEKYGIKDIEIYSNHFEFNNGNFKMDFPNIKSDCVRHAGTCKCHFIKNFKNKYDTVFYVGDGPSDYCAADKVDFLFAKKRLLTYCKANDIPYNEYIDFNEVINNVRIRLRLNNR